MPSSAVPDPLPLDCSRSPFHWGAHPGDLLRATLSVSADVERDGRARADIRRRDAGASSSVDGMAIDRRDDVAGSNTGFGCRPVCIHTADQHSLDVLEPRGPRVGWTDVFDAETEDRVPHAPVFLQVIHDDARDADRHGEPIPGETPGRACNRGIDADDFASHVD